AAPGDLGKAAGLARSRVCPPLQGARRRASTSRPAEDEGDLNMAEKPHMNVVFIGHVDAGKSTTVGRILLDTGHIEQHVIEKLKKEAEEKGKATFEFAFVMDNLKEERERGVTIDIAHKRFNTDKFYFTIID